MSLTTDPHADDLDPRDQTNETTFGTFHTGEEEFALAANDVREVVAMPKQLLPAASSHTTGAVQTQKAVVGVFNLRGDVVPVVDMRRLFGHSPTPLNNSARVAVLDGGDHLIGALFDRTGEVLRLAPEQTRPLTDSAGPVKGYLQAKDGRLITLLTPDSFEGVPRIPIQAEPEDEPIGTEATQQYLIVRVATMHLAIHMRQTLEINKALPARDCMTYFHHCDGVIALRGATVARLDLRAALHLPPTDAEAHKLAFVHDGQTVIALPVDDVVASVRVEAHQQVAVELIDTLHPDSFLRKVLQPDPVLDLCPGGVPVLDVPGLFDTCEVNPHLPEGTGAGLLTIMEAADEEEDHELDQFFLTFAVGKQTFGLEMTQVQEIRRADDDRILTPDGPESLVGFMSIRGQVLPLIDLNSRYGEPVERAAHERCVIVTETDIGKIGLLVDQLGEIIRGEHTKNTGTSSAIMRPTSANNRHAGMHDVHEVHTLSERYEGRLLYLLDPNRVRTPVAGIYRASPRESTLP